MEKKKKRGKYALFLSAFLFCPRRIPFSFDLLGHIKYLSGLTVISKQYPF